MTAQDPPYHARSPSEAEEHRRARDQLRPEAGPRDRIEAVCRRQDGWKISQAYRHHRPYLVDLAFRMVGDIGTAEDVVQDAFARLMRADLDEIESERGWLIMVTSRLCVDQIRSAWSRREQASDLSEIEFAAPLAERKAADPADWVTFEDGVRLALLVVLRRLSPVERVVFVLHDTFRMPFSAVAQIVGRTAPACRQVATRARQKISGARAVPASTSPLPSIAWSPRSSSAHARAATSTSCSKCSPRMCGARSIAGRQLTGRM